MTVKLTFISFFSFVTMFTSTVNKLKIIMMMMMMMMVIIIIIIIIIIITTMIIKIIRP